MADFSLLSSRDALLFGVPMVILLAVGFFRLDELLARRPRPHAPSTRHPHLHRKGSKLGCDPDGKPLNKPDK